MSPDEKTVEALVQVITREILAAYNEQDIQQGLSQNLFCKKDCASGLCVTTCFIRSARWSAQVLNG